MQKLGLRSFSLVCTGSIVALVSYEAGKSIGTRILALRLWSSGHSAEDVRFLKSCSLNTFSISSETYQWFQYEIENKFWQILKEKISFFVWFLWSFQRDIQPSLLLIASWHFDLGSNFIQTIHFVWSALKWVHCLGADIRFNTELVIFPIQNLPYP